MRPFETAESSDYPTVRQISVFLENRCGQLLRLTKLFEETDIHILGLSIVHAVECAVARLLVDDPDTASKRLRDAGFAITESELLVVLLPPGSRGLLSICSALLRSEVSIDYLYPLLPHPHGQPAVALRVDDIDMAVASLKAAKFQVLDQSDLRGKP